MFLSGECILIHADEVSGLERGEEKKERTVAISSWGRVKSFVISSISSSSSLSLRCTAFARLTCSVGVSCPSSFVTSL